MERCRKRLCDRVGVHLPLLSRLVGEMLRYCLRRAFDLDTLLNNIPVSPDKIAKFGSLAFPMDTLVGWWFGVNYLWWIVTKKAVAGLMGYIGPLEIKIERAIHCEPHQPRYRPWAQGIDAKRIITITSRLIFDCITIFF